MLLFILQLRLDFTSFVITGPSTLTTTTVKAIFGQVADTGTTVSSASQCLTDSFTVAGSPASAVPVLCGTLTGDHSIVLNFNFYPYVEFKLYFLLYYLNISFVFLDFLSFIRSLGLFVHFHFRFNVYLAFLEHIF